MEEGDGWWVARGGRQSGSLARMRGSPCPSRSDIVGARARARAWVKPRVRVRVRLTVPE